MLAGLWPVTDGAVYLPLNIGRAGSFFLPQRPFIAVGTLRDQILYPDRAASQDCGDEELVEGPEQRQQPRRRLPSALSRARDAAQQQQRHDEEEVVHGADEPQQEGDGGNILLIDVA